MSIPKTNSFLNHGKGGAPWRDRCLLALAILEIGPQSNTGLYQMASLSRHLLPSLLTVARTMDHLLTEKMVSKESSGSAFVPVTWTLLASGREYLAQAQASGWVAPVRESFS